MSRASARTFILTLDTVHHLSTLDRGTKRNVFSVRLRSLLEWELSHRYSLIGSSTIAPEVVPTPPTLPAFYPHSDEPLRARCNLGSDFKPRPIIVVMDLGCWGAAI